MEKTTQNALFGAEETGKKNPFKKYVSSKGLKVKFKKTTIKPLPDKIREAKGEIELRAPMQSLFLRYAALHGRQVNRAKIESIYKTIAQTANSEAVRKADAGSDTLLLIANDLKKAYNQIGNAREMYAVPEPIYKQLCTFQYDGKPEGQAVARKIISKIGKKGLTVKMSRKEADAVEKGGKAEKRGGENWEKFQSFETVEPQTVQLYGLQDLQKLRVRYLPIPAKYKKLLGKADAGSRIMIGGPRGGGKSTAALELASGMDKNGIKTLYVSLEERPETLKEKSQRLKIEHLTFADVLPDPAFVKKNGFKAVFIDSVTVAGLTPKKFEEYCKALPKIFVFGIFQGNKDGSYKGGAEYASFVDCVLDARGGAVTVDGKNRLGGNDRVKVY